jgi:hypothetical protein
MAFNGAGQLTSGSVYVVNQNYAGGNTAVIGDNICNGTVTGTYSINSDATGTMSLTGIFTGSSCDPNAPTSLSINAILAGGGSGGVLYSYTSGEPGAFGRTSVGSFAKQ